MDRPRDTGPALSAYIDRLPVDAAERQRLLAVAADGDDAATALARVHRALGGVATSDAENPAWDSIGARLRMVFRTSRESVERRAEENCIREVHGQPRLSATPALKRASMVTRPWSRNPIVRVLRSIGGRLFGQRGLLASRDTEPEIKPDSPDPVGHWRRAGTVRRLILLVLMLGQTYVATYYMTAVLPYHGTHILEIFILILYAILFAWVSAGFWTAMMGFLQLLLGRDRYSITNTAPEDAVIDAGARTAILVPICNESVPRVFAGVRATYDSLARTGELKNFDFFILSDSNEPDVRVAELEAWLRLCRAVDGFGRIFYRRRTHRIKRKSGNIADFCRRWGSEYRYMLILDADSVMSGPCLKRLVQLMEANPNAGIIQTAPRAAGRDTMYARIQQFATRVYGPLFTAGLHFWQLGESHYWGHNAIIRVAPFIRHCSLPRLPGKGSLAGEILSHDFVEAALMRRAGWAVWIAYDLPGSYEEMPPNLLDELKRDRRWCQGNLQNFRLFLAQGLHPAHRAVFMTGVMAYLSAPLWFLSLLLSTALLAVETLTEPTYFVQPYQLFPLWPEWHPEWALALFSATATLLFLPKVLAVILIWAKGSKHFGGSFKLGASMLMELLFSAALAPVRMLFHTQFVMTALVGWTIQWKSPPREDAETGWGEALRRHGFQTLLGVVWAAGVYWLNPSFLWWLLPVVGALMLSIPLSVYSSRISLGRNLRAGRLFLIPEESNPPRELRWTKAGLRRTPEPSGFEAAVVDPLTNALICSASVPRFRQSPSARDERLQLLQSALLGGSASLSAVQKNMLLSDPIALSRLHFQVWTADNTAAQWQLPAS
ncbi:MAG: Glucans biosynthesis glucosyltransferase [Nevskia sp.]|nr:Glucans biosynthesis glucosyltransferase [Nevskia sp.]